MKKIITASLITITLFMTACSTAQGVNAGSQVGRTILNTALSIAITKLIADAFD